MSWCLVGRVQNGVDLKAGMGALVERNRQKERAGGSSRDRRGGEDTEKQFQRFLCF